MNRPQFETDQVAQLRRSRANVTCANRHEQVRWFVRSSVLARHGALGGYRAPASRRRLDVSPHT